MRSRVAQAVLLGLIHVYRHTLGLFLGGQCRHHPTCSAYALDAIRQWGAWRGSWMAARRIGRCHPLAKGGFDPVPPNPRHAGLAPGVPAATPVGDKP
jgi:hypothetical protein